MLWVGTALCAQDPGPGQPQERPRIEGERQHLHWFGGDPWLEWEALTGDWAGFRRDLQEAGVSAGGAYVFDWSGLWDGGIGSGTAFRSLAEIEMTLDLERLLRFTGAEVFTALVDHVGPDFSAREVGDIQVFDNMDTSNFTSIYDLWLQVWLGESARIKVGRMDANEDFAYLNEGLLFIQSTAGFPPTILAFPTYPDPTFGAVVYTYPVGGWFAGAGIYDGAAQIGISTGSNFYTLDDSDEYFLVGETGFEGEARGRLGPGRFAAGAWYASGDFERFDGGTDSGTAGFYVTAEQKLWREVNEGDFDDQGLAVMASYAQADPDISDFTRTILFATTYTGLIPGRDHDQLGALVSWADLSDDPAAGYPGNETAYELYYQIQVTPFLSLQPILSYIVNPSGQPGIDDALVGTLRGEITF